MGRRVQLNKVTYLGGHPSHEDPARVPMVLTIDDKGLHLRYVRKVFDLPWREVTAVAVEGPDQAARRITLTRLATIGVFAFGAQKNTSEAYLHIEAGSYSVGFQVPKTSAGQLRAQLGHWISQLPEAPIDAPQAPAQTSVADELAKLADLHRQGLLSMSEFEAQKARLLA